MIEEKMAELMRFVAQDESTQGMTHYSYIARCNEGVSSDFAFDYMADNNGRYFTIGDEQSLSLFMDVVELLNPQPEYAVVIMRINCSTDSIDTQLLYDDDAKAWFVPIGEEDVLAELAR